MPLLQTNDFDLACWDEWRETRRIALVRLYTRFAMRAEAGKICLNVIVRPDSDPALDGFRVVTTMTRTIDAMTSIVPPVGMESLREMNMDLPDGVCVAPIILHLHVGQGSTEQQRSFIISIRFRADSYDKILESMLFDINDRARSRYATYCTGV